MDPSLNIKRTLTLLYLLLLIRQTQPRPPQEGTDLGGPCWPLEMLVKKVNSAVSRMEKGNLEAALDTKDLQTVFLETLTKLGCHKRRGQAAYRKVRVGFNLRVQ